MHGRSPSSSLPLVCVLVALAAACGGDSKESGFSMTGDDAGAGTGSGGGGPTADGGGIGGFGDGGPSSSPEGGPSAPHGCDPSCAAAGGTCQNGSECVIVENPGGVAPPTQGQLQGGGASDPGFAWLYPYDETVFPRGLVPPTLQLAGTGADAAYVHVSSSSVDYKGYFAPKAGPTRLVISAPAWTALTLAAGAKDVLKVDVSKISGGAVSGPVSESWSIAQGSLRGTIYYETYDSTLAMNAGGGGGVGIMRIQPGAAQPTVVASGCGNVCHTASADGSTLVAHGAYGLQETSVSYDLKNNASVIFTQPNMTFTYGGLYPDGSLLMSATSYRTWLGSVNGTADGPPAALYDTHTGAKIAAPGWDGVISDDGTPAFSPDGRHIAFNHEDTGGGHTLAVMSFDSTQRSFSSLVDVAQDTGNTLAWPSFTPDSSWIVYQAGSNAAFETDDPNSAEVPWAGTVARGDLFIVDRASHSTHRLDALDGYGGAGTSYLPADDPSLSFAPTVLPEAVGGYFWVVFTSHRSYGNTLASEDQNDVSGKLWVAAIDLSPTAGQDPSHPAFYLDGQEPTADNLRGFWVLSPCESDGNGCASGDECCGGYCRSTDGGSSTCSSIPGGCSAEYDKCTTAADCCNSHDLCINGRCAQPSQ